MKHLENFNQLKDYCDQSSITWYTTFMTLSQIVNLSPSNYKKNFDPAKAFNGSNRFYWSHILPGQHDTKFTLHNINLIKNSLPIKTHIMLNYKDGNWTSHPGGTRLLLADVYHENVPVIIADNSNTLEGYSFNKIPFTTSNVWEPETDRDYYSYSKGYTEIAPLYTQQQFHSDEPALPDVCYTIDRSAGTISADNKILYEWINPKWRLTTSPA